LANVKFTDGMTPAVPM